MKINKELPSPAQLKEEYPLSKRLEAIKQQRVKEIRDVFIGKSD